MQILILRCRIDTPGVIERVSSLFRGHPSLIQGFNTFLPAGYRIEVTTDTANPDFITVTTPMGTTTQAIRGSFPPQPPPPPPPVQPDFVPRDYAEPTPAQTQEMDIELALSYVQKVKARYGGDPEKYKAFLEILSPQFAEGGVVNDVSIIPLVLFNVDGCSKT